MLLLAGLYALISAIVQGLPAPGVVDEQLGVDAEQAVERGLVRHRAPRHVAHRPHPVFLQLVGVAVADAPEVRERAVRPETAAVGRLVQLRDADSVPVGGDVLRHDVHRHLGEIEVRADVRRGRNARLLEDALDEPHRELVGRQAVHPQVLRGAYEHLVDGIGVDVVGRDVPHVDGEDVLADLHVPRHSRRRNDVAKFQRGVRSQFRGIARLAHEAAVRRVPQPHGVRLTHLLHDLEEPRPSGDAAGLQRRRDRQADGLLRSGLVRNNKVGRQRVKPPVRALHRGVEGLEVYGYVCSVGHGRGRCSLFREKTYAGKHVMKPVFVKG